VSALLPDGVEDVKDVPHLFFDAVRSALVFLSFDELPSEERPPRRIWRDGQKLKEWFDAVAARREREHSAEPIEDPIDNQAAAGLIVG
jgi:hypothetical protein